MMGFVLCCVCLAVAVAEHLKQMTDYPVKYGGRFGDGATDYTFGANPDPGADAGAPMSGLLKSKKKKLANVSHNYYICIFLLGSFLSFTFQLHLFQFDRTCTVPPLIDISAVPVSLLVCISQYQVKVNSAQCRWCLESKQSVAATKVEINQVHWLQA